VVLGNDPMPRFVILRHENPSATPPVHWDFMLESGSVLQTWALESEPAAGHEIVANQLADHRLVYLDYEGPITQNRGSVTQWDAGQYTIVGSEATLTAGRLEFAVELRGRRLTGTARLTRPNFETQRWMFSLDG
jgi:DNA polymerase Ligase (LigD)